MAPGGWPYMALHAHVQAVGGWDFILTHGRKQRINNADHPERQNIAALKYTHADREK